MSKLEKQKAGRGKRFPFGENWRRFLTVISDEHIRYAEKSLKEMLGVEDLRGRSFLDIGSGSGLFSLAARRLGARVHSFDYDQQSVACTRELKRRFRPNDGQWIVESGSILDSTFLESLGEFDIVYSWGVLHHTGAMWEAAGNAAKLVKTPGRLFISIYNDQGRCSSYWRGVKQTYNLLPQYLRFLVLLPCFIRLWVPATARDVLRTRSLHRWRKYSRSRGMSPWTDVIDWVGGYPFEVAKPEEVFKYFQSKAFVLENFKTSGGRGCNEFLFSKAFARE